MARHRSVSLLLEREPELALLRDAWREARAGHGSSWLVRAEAGGGKTRLLREVARLGRTLWGAADPVAPPDPYLALLRAIPGFAPAGTRVGSAICAAALLEEHTASGPLILVLDDLHFADEGTVAALLYLASVCASRPWLMLAGLRPDEGGAALHGPLTELLARGEAQRLDLPPLSREAVGTLVAGLRGRAAAADEVERIHRDSGGNPWFVEALARGAGAMATVRDRILLRLDRLETAIPGARALLLALAPAGEPLPHDIVARLHGEDGLALRRLLRSLRDAGLLREITGGGWQFRHELIRRSLLETLIDADRRDAHRTLAEALEQWSAVSTQWSQCPRVTAVAAPGDDPPGGPRLGAAGIAMHFAEAGDARAAPWALRAAQEAAAIDAHTEALAQIERALAFEMPPETRRGALEFAAIEAARLGRFVESERFAEEGLAVPGLDPEHRARLCQLAADAARLYGSFERVSAHLGNAERALEGRPLSYEMGLLWIGRLLEAASRVEPERVAAAAARAREIARRLDDRTKGARLEARIKAPLVVSLLDRADHEGFAMLEAVEAAKGLSRAERIAALLRAYAGAVFGLFHEQASAIYERSVAALRRHEFKWEMRVQPLRVLELVQRGRYAEAATLAASVEPSLPGTYGYSDLPIAIALYEVRGGSPTRAGDVLAPLATVDSYKVRALADLVRLEAATMGGSGDAGALAASLYQEAERRRFARVAGAAAVALVRAERKAPSRPTWLPPDAPTRVFWLWAEALARRNVTALRGVAGQLSAMACPYEVALALRDAGDLATAYRALRDLGATAAREQTAAMLRAAGQPVPRRPRHAVAADGLTETERAVCRLVASGTSNAAIAEQLDIGLRTVEAHLRHVSVKTGHRGRAALAAWWSAKRSDER